MKLTMTHRAAGTVSTLATGVNAEALACHIGRSAGSPYPSDGSPKAFRGDPVERGRDSNLAVSVMAPSGTTYVWSGSVDEWRGLFAKLEELAGAAFSAGLFDEELLPDAPRLSGLITDPTPRLTADVRADMQASALDAFRTGGFLRDLAGIASAAVLADLTQRYGFTPHQVEAFGADAITAARAQWEREGEASDKAPRRRVSA